MIVVGCTELTKVFENAILNAKLLIINYNFANAKVKYYSYIKKIPF